MITGVILEKTIEDIQLRLENLSPHIKLLEIRIDYLLESERESLCKISFPLPVIFTTRPKDQGGYFSGSEEERLALIKEMAQLKPAYIDLEYTNSPEFIQEICAISPQSKIILSFHDFEKTPEDLEALLQELQNKSANAIYKIACMAESILDTLRLLSFNAKHNKLIAIAMGKIGETSRVLAPVVGYGISYTPIANITASGQMKGQDLVDLYNFPQLNKKTDIYALIGSPIEHSIGHLFHNKKNKEANENCVYVKWDIEEKQLTKAFEYISSLPVKGLSVTTPLKEKVATLSVASDEITKETHAINTLKREGNTWRAYNTDGAGTLNSIGIKLTGKRVIVLGAGGAAKAIILSLKKAGAKILVLNRTLDKLSGFSVETRDLNELANITSTDYDVIISTLPPNVSYPLAETLFSENNIAIDISYSAQSMFLQLAHTKGASIIEGKAMFEQQALLQREIWEI